MFKNRLSYAAVVLVLFIFVFLRDAPMTYTAFYAVLILPIISYVVGYFSKRNITAAEELSHEFVTKNEKTYYKVRIHNAGFLPCFFARIYFEFEEIGLVSNTSHTYFSIEPKSYFEVKVQLSGKYRGVYKIAPSSVVVYDFLGIFKYKLHFQSGITLIIAPLITQVPELASEITQQGETIVKRHIQGQDHTSSAELREYQITDSYKQIHWKATAKRNELISKNPQEIEQLATVFFINNLRIPKAVDSMLAREDKLMDLAVSVMSHCNQSGHRMLMQAVNIQQREFTTNFTRLYHEVAALPFGEFGSIHPIMNDYLHSGNMMENVFLFTQSLDDELILALQEFKLLGSHVTLFLFGSATRSHLRKLVSLDIKCVQDE